MIHLQVPFTPAALPDSVSTISSEATMIKSLSADELIDKLVNSVVTFSINLAIAVAVFYVGKWIINKIYNLVSGIFVRRSLERSLATFILSMIRIVLYFILIVTVIGILGIETSSFLALFASAGVAIGMALSGTLQNFAGGVLILLLKPYKIGDFIEAQGYAGTVQEIQIFHTIITTGDNKAIIIPNGGLSTGSINNYSREDYRRVEWTVGISYGDSVDAARAKILEILDSDDRIVKKYIADDRAMRGLKDPHAGESASFKASPSDCSPTVTVGALAASSVDLTVRAWTTSSTYWAVYYGINERIYNELPLAGISFPFPQLDIHTTPVK